MRRDRLGNSATINDFNYNTRKQSKKFQIKPPKSSKEPNKFEAHA